MAQAASALSSAAVSGRAPRLPVLASGEPLPALRPPAFVRQWTTDLACMDEGLGYAVTLPPAERAGPRWHVQLCGDDTVTTEVGMLLELEPRVADATDDASRFAHLSCTVLRDSSPEHKQPIEEDPRAPGDTDATDVIVVNFGAGDLAHMTRTFHQEAVHLLREAVTIQATVVVLRERGAADDIEAAATAVRKIRLYSQALLAYMQGDNWPWLCDVEDVDENTRFHICLVSDPACRHFRFCSLEYLDSSEGRCVPDTETYDVRFPELGLRLNFSGHEVLRDEGATEVVPMLEFRRTVKHRPLSVGFSSHSVKVFYHAVGLLEQFANSEPTVDATIVGMDTDVADVADAADAADDGRDTPSPTFD